MAPESKQMTRTQHEYVPRLEFEERLEQLDAKVERGFTAMGARFDALVQKLDEKAERRAPKLWEVIGILIAAVAGIGLPTLAAFFAIVVNMADTRALQAWAESHSEFSTSKAAELDTGISDARSRIRAVEMAIEEQEMQHRWMADVANLQDQRLEQLVRLKHPEVPASDYWPLQQIGKAVTKGD